MYICVYTYIFVYLMPRGIVKTNGFTLCGGS